MVYHTGPSIFTKRTLLCGDGDDVAMEAQSDFVSFFGEGYDFVTK
jgi:hypothetical protein